MTTTIRYINAARFGVKEDGLDKTKELQAAIDYAVKTGVKKVLLPAGKINIKGVLVANKDKTFLHGFEIIGSEMAYGGDHGTVLQVDKDGFGIAFQRCKGYKVSNISFNGQNPLYYSYEQVVDENTDWSNGCRDNSLSPHCGVVVDPFVSGHESYPGWDNNWDVSGSTSGIIENCSFRYFVSGIAIKPCGSTGNGEMIKIQDCHIQNVKFGITVGDNQCRSIQVNNLRCWGTVYSLFDGTYTGNAMGSPVSVTGLNLAGGVKYLVSAAEFQNSNGYSFFDCHIERLWSLNDPAKKWGCLLNFFGSWVNFDQLDDGTFNDLIFNGTQFNAFGSTFTYYVSSAIQKPLMKFKGGAVNFFGCVMDGLDKTGTGLQLINCLENGMYITYTNGTT